MFKQIFNRKKSQNKSSTSESDDIEAFKRVPSTLNRPSTNVRSNIKHVVAVGSGKGGVGKSSVSVNLARSLNCLGFKVGVLDADIYGPSVPIMLGLQHQQPDAIDGKWMKPPTSQEGIVSNSIGYLVPAEDAAVWRGPMASRALMQLFNETLWGELDFLIVDLPPGTGDIQLTLTQQMPVSCAVVVTTPQNIALADAEKAIAMFAKLDIQVAGVVENMSLYTCAECGHSEAIFGQYGGQKLQEKHKVPLIAQLPLDIKMRETMDNGDGTGFNNAPYFVHFEQMALKLVEQLSKIQPAKQVGQHIPSIQIKD
ncbi:ParA/MinD-like ATPase [Catenovulum agarivorans DS-2]|uniref:Iron-sulfur cluster carrier protein n=1 Tax=Catenovulum agarivorans DS-2 TaxID=1328313 RepID=W7R073_9ALTE|nr:Mrp/NBP35 family ATP-binding protein [Catenovulum agarivorans]EWH11015.1 ParA/MinD-like ATPase [Catenovulum agarivorans DS-2]